MNGSYGFGAETILQLNRLTKLDLSFCVGIPLCLTISFIIPLPLITRAVISRFSKKNTLVAKMFPMRQFKKNLKNLILATKVDEGKFL